MTELQVILDALASELAAGRPAVLATVVGVSGSGYRRAGARMLVLEGGGRLGSVSGGCLEGDVCRRAWWLTESGPTVVDYDTHDDDGPYRLGCGGTVRLLLERFDAGEPADLREIRVALDRGDAVAVATVIAADPRFPAGVGHRWVGGDAAMPAVAQLCRDALRSNRTRTAQVEVDGRRAEVMIEVIRPATRLAVFGSGWDVAPVVRLAEAIGWRVTVVDRRPASKLRELFPTARVVSADPAVAGIEATDAAVVMTHRFPDDVDWVRKLLRSPTRYIGVLGARHRTDRLLRELDVAADDRLFAPVGLDLGGDTPEEIGLAVVAEARAVLAARGGGHLRDRAAPIHDPLPAPVSLTPVIVASCDRAAGAS